MEELDTPNGVILLRLMEVGKISAEDIVRAGRNA